MNYGLIFMLYLSHLLSSGALCIIVMFLSALILTAPIHYNASIAETLTPG